MLFLTLSNQDMCSKTAVIFNHLLFAAASLPLRAGPGTENLVHFLEKVNDIISDVFLKRNMR